MQEEANNLIIEMWRKMQMIIQGTKGKVNDQDCKLLKGTLGNSLRDERHLQMRRACRSDGQMTCGPVSTDAVALRNGRSRVTKKRNDA